MGLLIFSIFYFSVNFLPFVSEFHSITSFRPFLYIYTKPGVGQNIAFHASSAVGTSALDMGYLISAFLFPITSFSPKLLRPIMNGEKCLKQ